MKKQFLFVIIFSLCLCMMSGIAYAQDVISYDEAFDLVKQATDLRKSIVDMYARFDDYSRSDLESDVFKDYVSNYNGYSSTFKIRYRLVSCGYSLEEMKEKINRVFSGELADKCLLSGYFNHYYSFEGKDYYRYDQGVQVVPNVSSIEYNDDELNSFELLDNNIGVLTADYKSIWSDYRKGAVKVYFTFIKENGLWKISSFDESSVIFRQHNNADQMIYLNEGTVKIALSAVINDLYYITRTGGYEVGNIVSGVISNMKTGSAGRGLSVLGDFSKWEDYALMYCNQEIADRILADGRYFKVDNGEVLIAEGLSKLIAIENIFDDNKLTAENLRIVSKDDTKAIVEYDYGYLDYDSDRAASFPNNTNGWKQKTVTIEFKKESGSWKISGGSFIDEMDNYILPLTAASNSSTVDSINPATHDKSWFVYIFAAMIITTGVFMSLKKRHSLYFDC